MPTKVSKTTKEYEAIIGKSEFTPNSPINLSSDYNCGAVANELEYLRAYINYVVNSDNLNDLDTYFLEDVVEFFTTYKRIHDETDENYRNRAVAFLQRKNNKRWVTKWAIRDVFSYFFNITNIYVIENGILATDNLVLNSDLEDTTGSNFDNWTISVSGTSTIDIDTTNPFTNTKCAKYTIDASNSTADIHQIVSSVSAGDYKVSCFAKADIALTDGIHIKIQRSSDSYYYNFSTYTWQSGTTNQKFDLTTTYQYLSASFSLASTDSITITIERDTATSHILYVDRIRMGEYKTYPSINVLIISEGSLGGYASLSDGNIDQLIDRGDCESTTPPALTPETTNTLSNCTFAQSSVQKYAGSYSYLFTKTVASGTEGTVSLQANESNTDMHGLIAGKTYTFMARVFIPSGGILGSEVKLEISDYDGGWTTTIQAASNTYDSWQSVRVVRTIRAAATGIIVHIIADSNADNGETFYVDDIRVAEGDVGVYDYDSFLDNDYLSGAGGGFTPTVYTDLLDRIKVAGSYANLEFVERTPV